MNEEFHYYVVAFLCKQAGLRPDESTRIAYSSQYTDNALVPYEVHTDGSRYLTQVTHHFGFWDSSQETEVWIPFHFYPGDPSHPAARRADGTTNRFSVTPDSPNVKKLLVAALKTRNPYRVGIALHTYADSWAHQNFSGRRETWNSVDALSLIPPIGHAQVMRSPDDLYAVWQDPRLVAGERQISNYERFLAAARKIYKYLATFNRRDFDDVDFVMERLVDIVGAPNRPRTAEERKLDFLIATEVEEYRRNDWKDRAVFLDDQTGEVDVSSTYDKLLWLKHEVLHKSGLLQPRPLRGKPGFYESDYHHFHEAARAHRRVALDLIAHLF